MTVGSYVPLKNEMATANFQAWQYGPLISNFLPLFLSGFAVFFCLISIKIGTQRSNTYGK
jgi:hypothetical protein